MAGGSASISENMPEGLKALMSRSNAADWSPRPVDNWNPPFCGDLDIRIARDGTWYYLGSPIHREALVKLFASVLRKDEDGKHYLVTPVEKVGITVDDAPLLAVEMAVSGEGKNKVLTVRTNLGDLLAVGEEHPLRFEKEQGSDGLKPYIHVRGRLEARFTRALTYQLADMLEEHDGVNGPELGLWSSGRYFSVDPDLLIVSE
ncbi:MAG: DUF1285 domain-containing protein [Pseudomonadota bacterium]